MVDDFAATPVTELPKLFLNPWLSGPSYFGGELLGRTQMKAQKAAAAALQAHTASAA